jgi:hypothetical protein
MADINVQPKSAWNVVRLVVGLIILAAVLWFILV